jgi:NSS family neurotransmitter:Na+ symporter
VHAKNNKKMTWVRESGFIFAMIGSAVGFANILAFSAQCYRNGGGAFLIPFFAAILIIGLPMLFLEGAIGRVYGLPIVSAYGHILPKKWKTFGWIAALSCLTIGSFYSVLTSWSVAYTYYAGSMQIPADTAMFFSTDFLGSTDSLSLLGSFRWPIFLATVIVAVITWWVNSRSVSDGIEKICGIFMPLLFALVSLFAIVVCFLPGAFDGFYHFLNPDFSKLKDFRLWRDVFGHVFFSFSLGIGIVVGYSRHTKKETNIRRAMIFVALGDTIISIIAGFAIFGCVGFMSHSSGTPFHEIVQSGSTFVMGFIVFPKILHSFSPMIQPLLGALFFFCVFIAGITGVFSIVESVSGNFEVEFSWTRKKAVTLTVMLMLALSTCFCFGNGSELLGAIYPMVVGYVFLIGAIAQIIAFIYLDKKLSHDPVFYSSSNRMSIFFYCVKYLGLSFLVLSFFGALFEESHETIGLAHIIRWGWFLLVLAISLSLAHKKTVNAR